LNKELKQAYENISEGKEIRTSLIALKSLLKDKMNQRAFAYQLGGDFTILTECLSNEDPKVRKNAALVLGAMESDDLVPILLKAYREEKTLLVKRAYLKALENLDKEVQNHYLKESQAENKRKEYTEENRKHLTEEAGILQQLISRKEKRRKHTFCGYDRQVEIILLTNREQREATRNQIKEEKVTMLSGGLRFFTYDLEEIQKIRTYREMLFPIKGQKTVSGTALEVAQKLAEALNEQLYALHEEKAPFYFRTELKSQLDPEKKSSWVKNFSAALEKESGRTLINNPSDYEVEIRLIEGKDGSFVPLFKLFTIKDERFSYRREVIATSMAPDRAALLMELAAPWLKEGAQVLDPFCGVGTLLIERARKMPADPLYGLDIFEEAVIKARENSERAKIPIHYINRDVRDFTHEYLFDEIVSDLPLTGKTRNLYEIKMLYEAFLKRVPEFLKKDGMLFLYTSEENALKSALRECTEMKVLKEFLIQSNTNSKLYVIQYKG